MKVLVREALGGSWAGASDLEFSRTVARLALAGVDVGDKYHWGRNFVPLVETLAMQLVRSGDAEAIRTALGGIGVASCFSIVFDSVSIGARAYARHETLLITGLQLVHPVTGVLMCKMASQRSQGGSHTGEHVKALVLDSLGEAQLKLSDRRLRASAVVVGGDGAMTIGGEEHRHQSTSACEKVYCHIFPATARGEELTHWDLFHRDETGAKWAMKNVPLGLEVLDLSQIVLQLFGIGSGRVLFRGMAEFLRDGGRDAFSATGAEDPRPLRCSEGHASTRPMAYGYRTTEALYRNYRLVHLGLEARTAQSRGAGNVEKKSSQSIQKMVGVARRACALDFVIFLLVYRDANARILRPFAAGTQEVSAEAVEQMLRCDAVTSELRRGEKMLEDARLHLFVLVLCSTYLGPADVENLGKLSGTAGTARCSRPSRCTCARLYGTSGSKVAGLCTSLALPKQMGITCFFTRVANAEQCSDARGVRRPPAFRGALASAFSHSAFARRRQWCHTSQSFVGGCVCRCALGRMECGR